MAGVLQDTGFSNRTNNSINRHLFLASFLLKSLKLSLEDLMPSFLLLFEIASGQLAVLVWPRPLTSFCTTMCPRAGGEDACGTSASWGPSPLWRGEADGCSEDPWSNSLSLQNDFLW